MVSLMRHLGDAASLPEGASSQIDLVSRRFWYTDVDNHFGRVNDRRLKLVVW